MGKVLKSGKSIWPPVPPGIYIHYSVKNQTGIQSLIITTFRSFWYCGIIFWSYFEVKAAFNYVITIVSTWSSGVKMAELCCMIQLEFHFSLELLWVCHFVSSLLHVHVILDFYFIHGGTWMLHYLQASCWHSYRVSNEYYTVITLENTLWKVEMTCTLEVPYMACRPSLVKPSRSLPLIRSFHYSSAHWYYYENLRNALESNCDPLSITTSLGMPCLKKIDLQHSITPSAIALSSFAIL